MKISTLTTSMGILGLFLLGVTMVKTNPNEAAYQQYAVRELSGYIKSKVCKKTPTILENILNVNCDRLVDSAKLQIRDIIAATTLKQDFLIFSIYHTDLKLNDWVPSYKFETVGAFNNFYTYSVEKN